MTPKAEIFCTIQVAEVSQGGQQVQMTPLLNIKKREISFNFQKKFHYTSNLSQIIFVL